MMLPALAPTLLAELPGPPRHRLAHARFRGMEFAGMSPTTASTRRS